MKSEKISDLSPDDRNWLQRAESHILKIVSVRYGVRRFGKTEDDLDAMQRLIDDRVVSAEDLLEAQCIGVVLGNVIASQEDMWWMRVENEYGDMIALRHEQCVFTSYPLTMISKRLEDGRAIQLVALYRDVAETLRANRRQG